MKRNAKQTAQQREAEILAKLQNDGGARAAEVVSVDLEARTVELAFSSEAEVQRWFGIEVLSHDEGACDLSRLNDGGAVLDGHDWSRQTGVVERAWIDSDRKGRALVRYSRNPEGEAMLQDIADRIKRHVSVGYRILAIKLTEEREDVDVYTVTRWQPYEISNVPIPADTTVGVGRSADDIAIAADIPSMERASGAPETSTVPPTRGDNFNKGNTNSMKTTTLRDASGNLVRAKVDDDDNIVEVIEVLEKAGDAERNARSAGFNAERERVRSITDLANKYGRNVEDADKMARDALANGETAEQFQAALLKKLDERASKPLNEQLRGADIGMSDREVRAYSLVNVIRALTDPSDRAAQRAAAAEFEASEAARANQAKDSGRFVIPTDVLRRSIVGDNLIRAPLNTGVGGNAANGSTGGNVVATDLLSASFIDVLRNATTIMRRGRVLGGLVGNVDIPKKTGASQSYWLNGEDTDTTETGVVLGQVSMTPRTLGAFTEVTRKMIQQSSLDIEALVRADLAEAMALGIDLAGYYGTGANGQPLGIANLTGINAVAFAGDHPTFGELVDMETAIGSDNAIVDAMAYVGNAQFRGHCKKTQAFEGTGRTLWEQGGTVNGYGTEITNQIATGDVFLNNFADLIIGLWGGLEMNVDPYTHSRKGRIRVVTFQDVDFAHRRVESFCLGRKAP